MADAEGIERATEDLIRRVTESGRMTYQDVQAARSLLADPSFDFERGDVLTVATLIAIADGDRPEVAAYRAAAVSDDQRYRYGMYAQAESRVFGYLDARGRK